MNDDVTVAVTTWLYAFDQNVSAKAFNALVFRWNKCLNRGDDYVEK